MGTPRAWKETDLEALAANLATIRNLIGPHVALVLVAKSGAYGHGAVRIARHALCSGADALAVTTVPEAMELRNAGLGGRVLVLGPVFEEEAREAIRADLELCLPSPELLEPFRRAASQAGRRARVHPKLDTGLSRLGVAPDRFQELLAIVRRTPELELGGVMTHLAASSGIRATETARQLARFEHAIRQGRAAGLLTGRRVWCHAASSAAVLSGLENLHDAVRIGLAAYGISPDPTLDGTALRPVLSVRTRVVHLRSLPAGTPVGYGGGWTTPGPTRIAVLPLGYDDGVDVRLGNRGHVLIRGSRVPIVGRVSMAYTTIDVTGVPGVEHGDEVTLLGRNGAQEIRAEELAAATGTIPYQVVCALGRALPARPSAAVAERAIVAVREE